ncbi:MAG: glycosyltransferase [Candidatus Nanopelagicales bacterium]
MPSESDPTGLGPDQPLTRSELFDAHWYRSRYPDVSTDPLTHYRKTGWREGRDPSPLFDTDWYEAVYSDLLKDAPRSGTDPLDHFLTQGCTVSLRPQPLFDPDWYAATHPDSVGWAPYTHYVRRGSAAGLPPGPAVAAVPRPQDSTPSAPWTATVVIGADEDFMYLERCLNALARTEVADNADVVVIKDRHDLRIPWHLVQSLPFVQLAVAPPLPTTDYVLVLAPDTEPQSGFLDALVRCHRAESASHDSVAASPQARAILAAAGIPGGWTRLGDLALPPQAALITAADWAPLSGSWMGGRATIRLALQRAKTTVIATTSWVLTHRPMTIARAAQRTLAYADPEAAAGLTLLVAEVDHPVGQSAYLAWMAAAACDMAVAQQALTEWETTLEGLSCPAHDRLPRLIRRRAPLVRDIVADARVAPAATQRAAEALAHRDPNAAAENLRAHPESFPAAVAVIALAPRQGCVELPAAEIPHVIVQGWFDSPAPNEAMRLVRGWRDRHPGWHHLFFDTSAAAAWIKSHLGSRHEAIFRSATPVGKSNLFRYAYLSECGGVWSDIDDRCLAHVGPLVDAHSLVVTQETIGAVADNVIMVVPGHPALEATRDEAFHNVGTGSAASPWLFNGPGLFTRKVAAHLARLSSAADNTHEVPRPSGYRILSGYEMSGYVAMHEPLPYKETTLAWDVPDDQVLDSARTATP